MAYAPDERTATLVEVANLYYEEGLTQREIAERLSVSRSLIAQYLQQARDRGIVQIRVVNPQDACANLEMQLRDQAGLDHVVVVPHGHRSAKLRRRAIASAGAKFLDEHLRDGDVLGLVWGRTVSRLVELLAPTHPRDIEVVPLLGESKYVDSYTRMNELILETASHFDATPNFLLAPMIVADSQLRDALMEDPAVSEVTRFWNRLSVACFGIGVLPPAAGQIPYVGEQYTKPLLEMGAVGDVCGFHHYGIDGQLLNTELLNRAIGVGAEQLMNTPCRLAVAGGVSKTPGVVGGLRSGLITSLIVDAELAQSVLEELG
ncbi:MAG: sugar-binding domain-containing protein [Anaerolineae bacterium]|jgi:DNA-binding transcriptional regulator LsrR (DeoR family)